MPTHRYPGMVAGAAGNKDKSPTPLDLFDVVLQSSQNHWKADRTANPSFCSIIFHLIKKGHKKPMRVLRKNVLTKQSLTSYFYIFFFYMYVAPLNLFKHNEKKTKQF